MNKISYKNVFVWLILATAVSFFANSTALAATVKTSAKKSVSKSQFHIAAKKISAAKTKKSTGSGKTASVAYTLPPKNCIQAVLQANRECKAIAGGCYSASVTPHCIAANKTCEEKQQAALALCP